MAYVVPSEEEDEATQQQNTVPQVPKLGGISPLLGAATPSVGQAPAQETPKAQNATQKGSGFTNLENWLDAGKGREQQITNTGGELLGKEQTAFNAAAKPVQDASFTAKGGAADLFSKGDDTGAAALLTQKYTGPRDVNYDPSAQSNLWDVSALAGNDPNQGTIGSVLAKPAIDAGRYGAGMRSLDNVLFSADGKSQDASKAQQAGLDNFKGSVIKTKDDLAKKVDGFDANAKGASDNARWQLQNIYDNANRGLNSQVASRTQQEAFDAAERAQGLVFDPATQGYRRLAPDSIAGATTGGGATRGNVISEGDATGFARLNKLIGTPTQAKTGDYQAPQTAITKDPNYLGVDPWTGVGIREENAAGRGTASWLQSQTDPNNPDGIMQKALAEGLSKDQAWAKWREFQNAMYKEFPELAPSNLDAPSYSEWIKTDEGAKATAKRDAELLAGTKYGTSTDPAEVTKNKSLSKIRRI